MRRMSNRPELAASLRRITPGTVRCPCDPLRRQGPLRPHIRQCLRVLAGTLLLCEQRGSAIGLLFCRNSAVDRRSFSHYSPPECAGPVALSRPYDEPNLICKTDNCPAKVLWVQSQTQQFGHAWFRSRYRPADKCCVNSATRSRSPDATNRWFWQDSRKGCCGRQCLRRSCPSFSRRGTGIMCVNTGWGQLRIRQTAAVN